MIETESISKFADDKKAYFEDLILLAGDDDFETITRLAMEQIDGIVERFNDGAQVKLRFYYDGDDLKLLSVYDGKTKSTQNTYFEDISFTVNDSITAVPTGIDVSPFLKTLFIAFLGSMVA